MIVCIVDAPLEPFSDISHTASERDYDVTPTHSMRPYRRHLPLYMGEAYDCAPSQQAALALQVSENEPRWEDRDACLKVDALPLLEPDYLDVRMVCNS